MNILNFIKCLISGELFIDEDLKQFEIFRKTNGQQGRLRLHGVDLSDLEEAIRSRNRSSLNESRNKPSLDVGTKVCVNGDDSYIVLDNDDGTIVLSKQG